MSAMPNPAEYPAVIFVDGVEHILCTPTDNARHLFDLTVQHEGGEVALVEWKPRHGIWLRSSLSITASKT